MEKIKEYSNGEVTVVWKPGLCIHSAKCVHGSPEVFKPEEKPWVQIDKANIEAVIATIKTCPSGALSYYMNASGNNADSSADSSETRKVEVVKDGPLLVHGSIEIAHDNGSAEKKKRTTAFCRCAKSANQPFCDGSHNA